MGGALCARGTPAAGGPLLRPRRPAVRCCVACGGRHPGVVSDVGRGVPYLTQVQGGRRDKLRPGDILGALTSSGSGSGLSGADVGTIEVTDQRTWVAVRSAAAAEAAAALGKTRIKKSKFKVHLVDET